MKKASNRALELEVQAKSPDTHILLSKGPFCTPRSVIKNMTTKIRPKLDEIAEHMKKLDDRNIGTFITLTHKERAYFKPLPEDANKEAICSVIGERWEEYCSNFKTIDIKYITVTQFNRLFASSPHSAEEMAQYDIHTREA